MTIEDLLGWLGSHPVAMLIALIAPPLVSTILGLAHGRAGGGASPWRYLHSLLVHLACVPGMFAVVITAYAFFFRNESLLRVNVLVYFLPILSMAATLVLSLRAVGSFDKVPGFRRLSGAMLMLGLSLGIAFALHRFHFGIFFFGPVGQLVTIAAVLYALLQLAAGRLTGGGDRRSVSDVIKETKDRK